MKVKELKQRHDAVAKPMSVDGLRDTGSSVQGPKSHLVAVKLSEWKTEGSGVSFGELGNSR